MNNKTCEMVEKNLCLGCVGLAEEDWQGKYKCKIYQDLKKEEGKRDVYIWVNNRTNFRSRNDGNTANMQRRLI